jgi:hypothetical protein
MIPPFVFHFSSLLPTMLLNSSVVIPRHDLWIHLSQSSQAITFVLHALSQMPQGNREFVFYSIPCTRKPTRANNKRINPSIQTR